MEHIRELRDRLFKSVMGVLAGLCIGLYFAHPVQSVLIKPYCAQFPPGACAFNSSSPITPTLVWLKIALYLGLILSSPVWLYQLWAFIAPGLHRKEKRWTYLFVVVAVPLFLLGAVLAHVVTERSLKFLLPVNSQFRVTTDISGYLSFIVGMLLIFGVGFEFPLIVFMLNVTSIVSAKRLLGWWRPAVFLSFVFTAIATPTPDPFGMTALGICMSALYFAAVGAAFLNERRRNRALARSGFPGLSDDEASPLEPVLEPIEVGGPVRASDPIEHSGPIEPSGPIEHSGPIEPSGPIEHSGPIEPSGPIEHSGPIEPSPRPRRYLDDDDIL